MTEMTMYYPGDPPVRVVKMTREEFFSIFPPHTRKMSIGPIGGPPDEVVHLGTNIMCDCCGEDPEDTIYLKKGTRAYCQKCFEERLKRYCTPRDQQDGGVI